MKLAISLFSFLLIVSCGMQEEKKKAASEFSVNGLTSEKGWCNVENIGIAENEFQYITRVTFLDHKNLKAKKITVLNSGSATGYKFEALDTYQNNSDGYFNDTYLRSVRSVEEVENLKDFKQQKDIAEKVFSQNQNILPSGKSFAPSRAITLKTSGLPESTEKAFYPCESYSPTFDLNLPVRPVEELQILLGQETYKVINPQAKIAKNVFLKLPLSLLDINDNEIQETQWCAWFEPSSGGEPNVTILTIKNSSFRKNSYPGMFDFYERYSHALTQHAESAETFDVGLGKSQKYFFVEDANGSRALAEKESNGSGIAPYELFYNCNDQRPLNIYPEFRKGLKLILDNELKP